MARLRVLSWNLRTFATHPPNDEDLRRMAQVILQSQADIVCVQEVQIGAGVIGEVGASITASSLNAVRDLFQAMHTEDLGGSWAGTCSGVNSGIGDHMRDAYAFFWKQKPTSSKFAHTDPPTGIQQMADPVILRQQGDDHFPGRRPGMLSVNVHNGSSVVPVNIISYHAQTPVNKYSHGEGAGYGVNALATLAEIGGGMHKGTGYAWDYEENVMALPQVDTVVVGDFNFSMDETWAEFTYANLLSNYQPCVSDPKQVVYTTYAPDATQALRLVSAYDNIFVLRGHSTFTPNLTAATGGAINFIQQEAEKLGQVIGVKNFGTESAWYVTHLDNYKRQHAVRGLSDHLPVWAEFVLGAAADPMAQHVQPTSGTQNNCLLHAVFGAPVYGWYRDLFAGAHRMSIVAMLESYLANRTIPADGRFTQLRYVILSAMVNEFASQPDYVTQLRLMLDRPSDPTLPRDDPFAVQGFDRVFDQYVKNIAGGRMFWVQEAAVVAYQADIPVTAHYPSGTSDTFNPESQKPPVHIFHQGLHFSRWLP